MSDNVTLVRFFDKKEYAEKFLSGKLRVGRLRYYRNLESAGRGDPNEGVSGIYIPKDSTLRIGETGKKLRTLDDGLIMAKMALNSDLDSHVLCMTKVYYENGNNNVKIHFGDLDRLVADFCGSDWETAYVVIIMDPNAFLRRLSMIPYFKCGGFVGYVSFDSPHKSHVNKDIFLKDNKYSYQREFRLRFDLHGMTGNDHFHINIGEISKIACSFRLADHI